MAAKTDKNLKGPYYCLKCGHMHFFNEGHEMDTCPTCHEPLVSELSSEEAKKFSVKIHGDRTKGTEKYNTAMCFVVLGTLGDILGGLFMVLSMQRIRNTIAGINTSSFQFVLAVIFLIIGTAALGYGIYVLVKALKAISTANREINLLGRFHKKASAPSIDYKD